MAHNKKVLGSNPPWLGPFGVEFACCLGAYVVLSVYSRFLPQLKDVLAR